MTNRKDITADILICGGGVPGLTLGALLGQAGLCVVIADRFPAPTLENIKPDGRTAALMQGSLNILKATGAWPKAARFGEELRTLRIIDDHGFNAGEPVQVDFRAQEIHMDAFGVNMPNAPLRAALAETAGKIKTVRFIEAALEGYQTGAFGIAARFDNGQTVLSKLIVGADGRNSATRKIAGIGVREYDYKQQAITCLIDHTKPHDNISTEFHRPSGPFTLVPLPGRQSSVVWVDYDEQANSFMTLSQHAFERALQQRSQNILGEIALATPPQSWKLRTLKAKKMTAPRAALIAEAAHVLHPIGAQGLNLSLRDAAALAEVLVDAVRLGLDPGSEAVLAQYERQRRRDVWSRVIGTHGLNKIVSNNFGPARVLRKAGLKTLNNITPLKEFAMHQGLAPRMEDGRLIRGEAL